MMDFALERRIPPFVLDLPLMVVVSRLFVVELLSSHLSHATGVSRIIRA